MRHFLDFQIAREDKHHGENKNIYLRDMNNDNFIDIVHSTRDYSSYHGAHIALKWLWKF